MFPSCSVTKTPPAKLPDPRASPGWCPFTAIVCLRSNLRLRTLKNKTTHTLLKRSFYPFLPPLNQNLNNVLKFAIY